MHDVKNTVYGTAFSPSSSIHLSSPENKSGLGRYIKVKKPVAKNSEDGDDKPGPPQQGIWP